MIGSALDLVSDEFACLDERRWDDWLALYVPDCEYWVPTWITEEELAADPRSQLSHVYYSDRRGLEDRIARIRTGKSPASSPMRRTTHLYSNPIVRPVDEEHWSVRISWVCFIFDPVTLKNVDLHGYAIYRLRKVEGGMKIAAKKIVLQNDHLRSPVDFYCL